MTAHADLVPRRVRAAFAHAAVQDIATGIGARVLHIKGVAVDGVLTSQSGGTDADILVDPASVGHLLAALSAHGWSRYSNFETGSPFGHAATLEHPHWGYADLHRFFPGMHADPTRTFEVLWAGRRTREIAGMPCAVPNAAGQALVLVLNNLRGGRPTLTDPRVARVRADDQAWAQVVALVPQVRAEVAFDAAHGRLEEHRGQREYWMWKVMTEGGSRSAEWLARVRAEPTLRGRARLLARAPLVNTEILSHQLGHPPTRREVAHEFVRRAGQGAAEGWAAVRRRLGREQR